MFELTKDEYNALEISSRSQFVTLNNKRGTNIKYAPLAFTEQGVAMLSSVLKSSTAIQINISIMRAFVTMRNYVSSVSITANHQDLVLGLRNSGYPLFLFFVCQFYLATNDLLRIMILSCCRSSFHLNAVVAI